jgi:hypothetical protein
MHGIKRPRRMDRRVIPPVPLLRVIFIPEDAGLLALDRPEKLFLKPLRFVSG